MPVRTIKGFRLALLAGASAFAATAAHAQQEASTEVEELVIVGSQIKGAKVTDVLPVTVLDTEDIDAAAPTSGDELFRSIPQAGDVSFNESRLDGGINDARGDTASINLRGLGTGNTLMLLNGRRLVLHPAIQVENLVPVTTVNTNAIPVMGVRRVEVLRDGASAIYGTDAVAGVINTVLKNSFDGFSATIEYSGAANSDMRQYDIDFEWGHDFNGGRSNVSLFGSYTHRDPLWASERDYAASSDARPLVIGTPFEGDSDFDNRTSDTPWGEFVALMPDFSDMPDDRYIRRGTLRVTGGTTNNATFHVQPTANGSCISTFLTFGDICYDNSTMATTGTDNNLRYNSNQDRTLWGEVDRINLFGFFNHEFENGIELFAEAGVYRSDYWRSGEQDTPLTNQRIIIPADAYWNPLGSGPNRFSGSFNIYFPDTDTSTPLPASGIPLELQDYRPIDAGPQTVTVDQTVTRFLTGLRGEWNSWDWESALVYSRAETDDTMRSISLTLFQEAVARTTADAYNPFDGADPFNPSSIDSTPNAQNIIDEFIVQVSRESHTSMALWDFKVSNPAIFEAPAGPVGMAAGVELRRETYGDDRDERLDGTITFTTLEGVDVGSDVMGVSPTPDTSGARNVQSAFLEFAVPVVSPEMGIPLIRSIDMQLAGRFENYTAFGSVAKPKVALSYYPVEWLQFRTAWSEGFRAPNLPQLFERGIMRSNGRADYIRCDVLSTVSALEDCSTSSVISNRSGSETLEPEESENFTAGVVFQSTMMPSQWGEITFTADYWRVEQTGIIGILGDTNQIILDYYLRLNGDSNPNVVRAPATPSEQTAFNNAGLAPAGEIIEVVDNYRNLGPREVEGVDIGLYYEIDDTPLGDFDVKLNAARLLTFYQEPGPEQQLLLDAQRAGNLDPTINIPGAESLIEENGRPKWRASATVTWRYGRFGAGYYSSYVGSVYDTSAALANGTLWQVDDWLTHNLYFQFTSDADDWSDGMRIRVGARNITDEDPPLADSGHGYIGDLHSPRGRTLYIQARKRF